MVYSAFLVIFRCSLSCPRLSAMLGILSSGIILTLFKCKERQLVFNENEVQSKGRKKKKSCTWKTWGHGGTELQGKKKGDNLATRRRNPSAYSIVLLTLSHLHYSKMWPVAGEVPQY